MLKIKLYGNREEGAALAEQIGKIARIRKCAKFFPDHSGAEIGDTYLEAEIEGAAQSKEEAERERAEKIREKVLDFIGYTKRGEIPLTLIVEDLTRHVFLFEAFGIFDGKEKYLLETLFSCLLDETDDAPGKEVRA